MRSMGSMGYYGSYIIMLPFLVFAMYAQSKVKRTFNKYLRVRNMKGLTGAEVARRILDANGLRNVKIRLSNRRGLSDHYDPRNRTVNLSQNVFSGRTISSISVAAHEVGHAIQHEQAYLPLTFRSSLAPVASISSKAAMPAVILGMVLGATGLVDVGIIIFSIVVLFQIATLPVEFNASSRALVQLEGLGLVHTGEVEHSKKVLNAAALTYVAAAASSIGTLLRLIILRGSRD